MNENKRILLLIVIMTVSSFIIEGITISVLYHAAFEEQKVSLAVNARTRAHLIESAARFNAINNNNNKNNLEAALNQIIDAYQHFNIFGETGELTLAKKQDNSIVFLISHQDNGFAKLEPIPFDSNLAEPMRRALSGLSGVMVGIDYKGHLVLAAYEPVAVLNLGIVTKIDIEEVRKPFIQAGVITLFFTIFIIFISAGLFIRITRPMITQLEQRIIKRTAQLIESEERHKRLSDLTFEGILFHKEGIIIDCNQSVSSITGYTLEELIGQNVVELLVPEKYHSIIRQNMIKKIGEAYEIEIIAKKGTLIPVELRARDIVSGGREIRVVAIRDITKRKKAEIELLESEEKYRIIFNNEIYAICIFDLETLRLLDVNEAYTKVYGYSREELISGMTIHDITAEHEVSDSTTKQAVSNGTIFIPLRYHKKKNGTIFPVEIVGGPYTWKGRKVMFALAHDITERKNSEKALKDSARYTRSLIEANLDPLVTIGYDGKITDVNKATELVTGYSMEQLIDSNFADYFTEPEKVEIGYNHVFETGSIRDYELNIRHKDGTITPVIYNAASYKDEYGKVIGVFAAARDISVRKRLEKERLELERRILNVQKLESLGRVAAGIAHNFNNIFMPVMGYMELAMNDLSTEFSVHRKLENALKSVKRAAELTNKILAYSGSGFFIFNDISIDKLIKENIHTFKSLMPETVSFSLDLTEDIHMIKADSEQIQRVIMNILVNSSEAIGKNVGTVTLLTGITNCYDDSLNNGLQRIDNPEEKLGEGRFVYIEISDTGCGMNEESIKLLSDPFFTTKFMGRGLGMAEVKGIIHSHKGAILIKSKLGQGTTIRLLFPVLESESKTTGLKHVSQEILHTNSLPKMIFVVDDDEQIREIYNLMLEHLGYRVMMAADGDEAVEIFKKYADSIHCVLLDLTMPKMDGISALKEMRLIKEDVKVIISSGHSKEEISERFKDYRFTGILQKPFEVQELKNELDSVIKR